MALVTVGLMTFSEIFGNVNFKYFAGTGHHRHLLGGILGYIGVMFFLVKSFSFGNLLYVSALWEGMIAILGSFIAYFFLHERFNHWIQYLGLILAAISVFFIHWGESLQK